MEIKSVLLEAEGNGESVGNLHGLAIVTAGNPAGHCLDNTQSLAVKSGMTCADNAGVGYRTVFTNDEFNNYATLDAFFRCGGRVNYVIAQPGIHSGFATGERGFLFYHCDADGFVVDNRFCDNLFLDLDLVKVIDAFGNIDSTELSFVLEHIALVLDLLIFFDFFVNNDKQFGNLLGVCNLFGSDDFFGFRRENYFFFLKFLFKLFLVENSHFLLGCSNDFFFFGTGEYTFHRKDKQHEYYGDSGEHPYNSLGVACGRSGAKGVSTKILVLAFEYYVAPLL